MNVVDPDYAVDIEKVLFYLVNFYLGGGFFKEKIKYFFKALKSVYEDEYRNTYRHDGIYQ